MPDEASHGTARSESWFRPRPIVPYRSLRGDREENESSSSSPLWLLLLIPLGLVAMVLVIVLLVVRRAAPRSPQPPIRY
jgi:hypothetical protein